MRDRSKPAEVDDQLARDFAIMGHHVEVPAIPKEAAGFKVMPVNWPAVLAFLGLETQWISVGLHTRMFLTGLDYGRVESFLRLRGLSNEVFDDLQIMENAALAALNEVYRRGR